MLPNKFLSKDGRGSRSRDRGAEVHGGSFRRRRERVSADQFLGYGWMDKEKEREREKEKEKEKETLKMGDSSETIAPVSSFALVSGSVRVWSGEASSSPRGRLS